MSTASDASVVFRVGQCDEEGVTTFEEREVRCDSKALIELLEKPWSVTPTADSASVEANLRDLSDVLTASFQRLRLEVREEVSAPGDRRWTLGFVPADDAPCGDTSTVSTPAPGLVELQTSPAQNGPVRMTGHVSVCAPGTEDGVSVQESHGSHSMNVLNTGLGVVNVGNLYAMIDMHLNVDIHAS